MNKQNENKPERGFLRLPQVIGNPKAKPPIAARIPVSKSTWWSGIREGRYLEAYSKGSPRIWMKPLRAAPISGFPRRETWRSPF